MLQIHCKSTLYNISSVSVSVESTFQTAMSRAARLSVVVCFLGSFLVLHKGIFVWTCPLSVQCLRCRVIPSYLSMSLPFVILSLETSHCPLFLLLKLIGWLASEWTDPKALGLGWSVHVCTCVSQHMGMPGFALVLWACVSVSQTNIRLMLLLLQMLTYIHSRCT